MRSHASRSRRLAGRSSRTGSAIILIALGLVFLLQQQQIISSSFNWWALFIIIPGILLLIEVFTHPEQTRTSLTGKLILSIVILLVGLVYLFNIQIDFLPDVPWATILPLFLILVGAALLLRRDGGKA